MNLYSVEIIENASYSYGEENPKHESFIIPKGYAEFEVEANDIEGAVSEALKKLSKIANNPDDFAIDMHHEDEAKISFANGEDGMDLYYEVIERF